MADSRIRRDVPIPYYYQLIRLLEENVESGKWSPGDLVPSEHDLCQLYGVSRTVVRQALGTLVSAGMLFRVKGKGTFVSPRKLEEKFVQRSDGFQREMSERGLRVSNRVLKQDVIVPPPHVQNAMQLSPRETVIRIDRLRSVENQVLMFVQTYIPYALCPGLEEVDLTEVSLYSLLREKYGLSVASGKRWVDAVAAQRPLSNLLEVPKNAPLLKIESVSFLDGGQPLEFYEAWHRADRSRFEIEIVVESARPIATASEAVPLAGVA